MKYFCIVTALQTTRKNRLRDSYELFHETPFAPMVPYTIMATFQLKKKTIVTWPWECLQ